MNLFIKYYDKPYKTAYRKIEKYLELLEWNIFYDIKKIEDITICPCEYKTSNDPPALSKFKPFKSGDSWGDKFDYHAWFHMEVDALEEGTYLRVYTEQKGTSTVRPQFLVYINGKAVQGMDTNHTELLLNIGHNDVFVYGYISPNFKTAKFYAETAKIQKDVYGLYYDIRYAFKSLQCLNDDSEEFALTLNSLHKAVSMLYTYDFSSKEFIESVKNAKLFLEKNLSLQKESRAEVVCIGHTHIDSAWLWTLKQTREKVQRSFSTVLNLMDKYPKYKFMASQPLQYEYLKQENPELFERVKQKINEGRWECEGSMWVESDCNLPSGESLIRQINLGKDYFKKEFNKDNHILWLPDVFGYPASLPQILKQSGIDWFVTSKISWNDTNKMPYDTFNWVGIDGSKVNTYFLTGQDCDTNESVTYTSYVGEVDSTWIKGTYKRYQQKELNNKVLLPFGWGDGGGGPTDEQLELLERAEKGISGCPKTKFMFVGDFFNELSVKMKENKFPTWDGELYFEYHRGTYTTMADNKKNNRKCEFLLQNAETFSILSNIIFGEEYPTNSLNNAWEKLLTNQFHDIIPGSSIRQVYEDSEKDYSEIFKTGNAVLQSGYSLIANNVSKDDGYVIFNPNSFVANSFVNLNGKTVFAQNIQPKGYTVVKDFIDNNTISVNDNIVETNAYKVVFDDNWQITSIYDKNNNREVIPNGLKANELRIYADYPDNFDAWNYEKYSNEEFISITQFEKVEIVEDGVRKGVKIVRPIFKSKIEQTVWFYDNLNKIDFETKVDWHEQYKMLKVAFPVDINTNKATFDIQFGSIERPTHYNTTWEQAKYETCGHKYVDLSEGGFGVSLLNDCKYGHDVHENLIQLSLLRGTTYPNEVADQGGHSFTYSLLSHSGNLFEGNTIEQAYLLNNPLIAIKPTGEKTKLPKEYSLLKISDRNIICETVKKCKRGDGIIVRLYEDNNKRTTATINFGFNVKSAKLVNLLEEEIENISIKENNITLDFKGFEIKTLKLTLDK